MLRISSGRSIGYTQVKMEYAPKLLKIPKSECPDIWIRLPRHKWPKSWSSMEDPVVPLERNLYGHPLAGLLWERQFEKNLIEIRLGESFQLGMLTRTPWKRMVLICVCGWWHQIGWKETKHLSDVETTQQRSRFVRTNIFPRSCILGLHSKTMWNKQRYCWQLQNHVWIQNFCWSNWKNYHARKIFVFLHGLMTWLVMRSVWKDIANWRTEQLNNSTKYHLHALTTIMSKKKNENPWENCQKYALKLFWNAKTWHVLEYPIFYVQWTNLHDRSQNGPKLVTNDYLVWSLTFIKHVTTNNIVMWETLPNNADWDCFKILTLREILKIQNPLRGEHCAFLEVIAQFNRIRNHFLGRRIEVGRYTRTWFMGSDRRSSSRIHVSE